MELGLLTDSKTSRHIPALFTLINYLASTTFETYKYDQDEAGKACFWSSFGQQVYNLLWHIMVLWYIAIASLAVLNIEAALATLMKLIKAKRMTSF